MGVNLQIPRSVYLDVQTPMARNLLKHMLEKREPRVETCFASAVQIDAHTDLGFFGIALNVRAAVTHHGFRVK